MVGISRIGRTRAGIGLLAAVVLTAGLIATTATSAYAASFTLDGSSEINPFTVSQGGEVLDAATVENDSDSGTATDVVVTLTTDTGTWDLKATKALNPHGSCANGINPDDGTPFVDPTILVCNVGDIDVLESATLNAVIATGSAGVGNYGDTTLYAESSNGGACESESCYGASFMIGPPSDTSNTTYDPPGGTVTVGPKKTSATDQQNGAVTLPKKELLLTAALAASAAASKPKPQPGPGAVISISRDDPGTAPGACGGVDCKGQILDVLDFPGYNDPAHPALMTGTWDGSLHLTDPGTLYIIKGGVGTPAPKCIKSHGAYTNLPCLYKHKFSKSTGTSTDTLAFISGDPGGAKR